MFKNIKFFVLDMVCDVSNHINSKIVIGIVSFIVASVLAFLQYETTYIAYFLTFSAGAFGFSCFDNKSAFQFKTTETKTENITTTKNSTTTTNIDAAKIVETVKGKKK